MHILLETGHRGETKWRVEVKKHERMKATSAEISSLDPQLNLVALEIRHHRGAVLRCVDDDGRDQEWGEGAHRVAAAQLEGNLATPIFLTSKQAS